LPGHQVERGKTIDLIFVIPHSHHRPIALHSQGRV
jgi:hypothetical protein